MTEKYQEIELDKIDEDVSNHRLVTDPASDQQLIESIQANGVQQPIKVLKKNDGRYTLVFGFRRTAMSRQAGLKTIPASVVEGLSPGDIRALQAIENLERKELHPMEEAEFCLDLVETLGETGDEDDYLADEVAKRVGRSTKWVESRLALARLSPRVKTAFLDGDIHLQHANLIARLAGHDAQEEVLGQVKARVPHWGNARERKEGKYPPATIAETRRHVENRLRDLKDVPWKLDAEFDGKIACSECLHNTANRFDLFDGDQPKKPQCLNAECFKEKNIFASRAVQRATNTLLKENDSVTPAAAKKAIKERDVEFVKPKAVTDAAKRRQEKGDVVTSSEKHGEDSFARDSKVRLELYQREHDWIKKAEKRINALLPLKDPTSLVAMLIVRESGLIRTADEHGKAAKAARAKLDKLLPHLLGDPDPGESAPEVFALNLRDIIDIVGSDLVENMKRDMGWLHPLLGEETANYAMDAITNHLHIDDLGPRPTFESIKAELFPPKEGEKKPAGKKKRVTKKAGGKKKAVAS